MSPEDAAKQVSATISVTREDIARAKNWITESNGRNTSGMADNWLSQQNIVEVRIVDADSSDCGESLNGLARAFSVRLAFYQAAWELVHSGALIAVSTSRWEPHLEYRTSRGASGVPVRDIGCTYPEKLERLPLTSGVSTDTDIFLTGINCQTLNPGILAAIDQSLACFRHGFYMPATVMLAAAAEATWTECGDAVATTLNNAKLKSVVQSQQNGIAKKVTDIHEVLGLADGRVLLKSARRSIHDVRDAEIWTTALRERRNALHWAKAKSFIADHSETGTLLMAAPQHIGTLEAIRAVC